VTEPDELSLALSRIAGEAVAFDYRETVFVHHWLWRWLGISDWPSLARMRRSLLSNGLLSENPSLGWTIDRGAADYHALLGSEESLRDLARRSLNGHVQWSDPPRSFDFGSGNGRTIYEMSVEAPLVRFVGSGLDLNFSVDGTLRNWLAEPHRAENLPAYRSESLHDTLLKAEIFSAAAFAVQGGRVAFDPFSLLTEAVDTAAGTVPGSALVDIRAATQQELDRMRDDLDEGLVTAAVAVGFIVDGLAGRARVPNGPTFSYEHLRSEMFDVVRLAVDLVPGTPVAREVSTALPELDTARNLVKRHQADSEMPPDEDTPLVGRLGPLGDLVKALAFAIRREEAASPVELLHSLANRLWSWEFFLEDRQNWLRSTAYTRPASSAIGAVRRWLERPWGVLDPIEVNILLGAFPSDPRPPDLLAHVVHLLREGVEPLLRSLGLDAVDGERRIQRLVANRCTLRDLRGTTAVLYPVTDRMRQAEVIVELATLWFYGLSEARRLDAVQAGLGPIRDAIHSGGWVSAAEQSMEAPRLSRRQVALLAEYAKAPAQVGRALFEFDDDKDLVDRLDCYPPQEFWIRPCG
jgi:hypothetical protein